MNTERKADEIIVKIDALLNAGEDAKAEEALIEAIAKYTEAEPDNIVGQSVLLNELGSFYRARGVFDKGEAAFLKAKGLLEEIRGYAYTVEGPAPADGCCACCAPRYDNSCCEDESKKHQTHTEILYTNESMTANYATTLNNLAGLYRMSRQFQKAAGTFDAAIKVYETCKGGVSPDYFASSYNNKGLLYLDMQDAGQARAMFLKAKEILDKGGTYPFALGTTLSNLGFAAVLEKDFPEAIALFQEAKKLFEETENHEMVQNCENILSHLEARR